MITPQFEVKQTEDDIIVTIRAPYSRVSPDSEPEVHVDCYSITFYSSPYYLRLTFPGRLIYDKPYDGNDELGDPVVMSYDSETAARKAAFLLIACFLVKVKKAVRGEDFPDLNMLTKLLAKPLPKEHKFPLIEVLNEEQRIADDDETERNHEEYIDEDDEDDEDDDDFFIEQEEHRPYSLTSYKYGFANQRSGILSQIQSELWEVFDLKDPDTTPLRTRRKLRIEDEIAHFSDDHYLADLYEDETIQSLLRFETKWAKRKQETAHGSSLQSIDEFASDEKETLLKLPRKEYILSSKESKFAMMGLLDILFAYAYNHRTTEGENTVSSGWTMCKLSSTLSWFDAFQNLEDVVRSSFQRSLCFPLYRNWQLSEMVFADVKDVISLGKTTVLKCLLEVRQMLFDADQHYILNDLYVCDYCVWIQSVKCSTLQKLLEDLNKIIVKKSDLDLDLEILEQAGSLAVKETEKVSDQSTSSTPSSSESSDNSSDGESGEDSSSDQDTDDHDINDLDTDDHDKEKLPILLKECHISDCQSSEKNSGGV